MKNIFVIISAIILLCVLFHRLWPLITNGPTSLPRTDQFDRYISKGSSWNKELIKKANFSDTTTNQILLKQLTETQKEEIENVVRKMFQQEIMAEVRAHRAFLDTLNQRVIGAITIIFTVIIAAFVYFYGRSVSEAKKDITEQIDSKIIEYRIVEANRSKINEFAEVAVANSKMKIDGELNKKLDLVMKEINEEVSKTITTNMLSVIKEEIEKIDQEGIENMVMG